MATVRNARDVLLLATVPRNIAPAAGAALLLTSDTPVFHVDRAGAGTPGAINFQALPVSLDGVATWSISAGGALTGAGNSRALAFASMTVQQVTVTVTLVHVSGVEFKASLVISKVLDGNNGLPGSNGVSGKSARICYTLADSFALNFNPSTVTIAGDNRPPIGTWGETRAWSAAINSAPAAGQAWFQSNGTYDPVAQQTVWAAPYLSNLKVGNLSALSTNTGELIFSGTCQSANGNVRINADGTFQFISANGNIQLLSDGTFVMRSGSSGLRAEISNGTFRSYDAAGMLRARMGVW